MKFDLAHYVQRGHHFAIVDEVDSILIDEARTPLIISGPGRRVDRPLLRGRSDHPAPQAGRRRPRRHQGRRARGARDRPATTSSTRSTRPSRSPRAAWRRPSRCCAHRLNRRTLYDPANMPHPAPRAPGAARPRAVQARRRLHGEGRRGRHRRRVHRPPDAGPALERRAAPGRRGQGEGEDRAREPDARDDHLPELLPQVHEARPA